MKSRRLNKTFLVKFDENLLRDLSETAKTLQMSTSALIRQSCARNLDVINHVEIPRLRRRQMAHTHVDFS